MLPTTASVLFTLQCLASWRPVSELRVWVECLACLSVLFSRNKRDMFQLYAPWKPSRCSLEGFCGERVRVHTERWMVAMWKKDRMVDWIPENAFIMELTRSDGTIPKFLYLRSGRYIVPVDGYFVGQFWFKKKLARTKTSDWSQKWTACLMLTWNQMQLCEKVTNQKKKWLDVLGTPAFWLRQKLYEFTQT